jgi:hypothetical protein
MSEIEFFDDSNLTIIDLIDEDRNLINILSANTASYEVVNYGQVIDQDGFWRGRPIDVGAAAANIIYVAKSGDDANNTGRSLSSSFLTIKKALNTAQQILTENNSFSLISVYPGIYVEDGNLSVPVNCGMVSSGGQYVTEVHASDLCRVEFRNMFLVNSGSYVQGFTFRNMEVDDFEDPNGGFGIAFNPGARIVRSPYIRDCSQVSNYNAFEIAAPLDPVNANPLVGRGGGMLLADRAILNPNSIFPYMLAFGATPRSPNGLGYVAKNGAGINGISSISVFQRAAFFTLNGGQITLNNSGTQFGDISMRAKGTTPVVEPFAVTDKNILKSNVAAADIIVSAISDTSNTSIIEGMWRELQDYKVQTTVGTNLISIIPYSANVELVASIPAAKIIQNSDLVNGPTGNVWSDLISYVNEIGANTVIPNSVSESLLIANTAAAEIIRNSNIIDSMWNDLITNPPGSEISWTPTQEGFTRRDARFLIEALAEDVEHGTQTNSQHFALEFFNEDLDLVFDSSLLSSFIQTFDYISTELGSLLDGTYTAQKIMIENLIDIIKSTLQTPNIVPFGTSAQEFFTRRDADNLIKAIVLDVRYGTQTKTQAFALGFFKYTGAFVFPRYLLRLFIRSWEYLRDELIDELQDYPIQAAMIESLFNDVIIRTVNEPNIIQFGTTLQEEFTRRDALNLMRALQLDIRGGTEMVTRAYSQGFFNYDSTLVMPRFYLKSFFIAYDYIQSRLVELLVDYSDQVTMLNELIVILKKTLYTPKIINFGSLVESLGHQFNNAGAGVNKNALPLNFRRPGSNRPVPFSVLQEEGGRVRWSGADEINNQYFAGGTQINGVTGKFEGRPFNISVRQIARRISNSRGFF